MRATTKKVFNAIIIIMAIVIAIVKTMVIVIVAMITIFIHTISPLSQKSIEEDFVENYDNIIVVTDYLTTSEHENIHINNRIDLETMFNDTNIDLSIDDASAIRAINTLFDKGYSAITKNGNTISFQRSTRLMDFGSGVAYSIDGTEPQQQFLTRLVALSEANWYYYEEDYNEWRLRN